MKEFFNKLPTVKLSHALAMLVLSVLFFSIALSLKPDTQYSNVASDLENNIPQQFGEWTLVPDTNPQVSLSSDTNNLQNLIYDDMLMRTYTNRQGAKIMLALAYAKEQRQDVKVHQPDICYPAQGYQMISSQNVTFDLSTQSHPVVGKRQLYESSNGREAVSYWIRIGDQTSLSGLQMRYKIIKDGLLENRYDDGILVRVSTRVAEGEDLSAVYALHSQFFDDLTKSVSTSHPKLLLPV
jgi:EpsI family protein